MVSAKDRTRPVGVEDELISSMFGVELGEWLVATFMECSGLTGEITVETYQEGGLNDYEHKLPGRTTWGNITLKGGLANTRALWNWFNEVVTGEIERQNVSIILFDQHGNQAMRWNLIGAYPVRWEGPSFSASDSDTVVHSLELAHNGLRAVFE